MENIIRNLKVGNTIQINNWKDIFTVCGVSENFILANCFESKEYTIIPKKPVDYCYNGIPVGSFVCSPDHLVFGYAGGYYFDNPDWVEKYLSELETGELEISMRRREKINSIVIRPKLTLIKQ